MVSCILFVVRVSVLSDQSNALLQHDVTKLDSGKVMGLAPWQDHAWDINDEKGEGKMKGEGKVLMGVCKIFWGPPSSAHIMRHVSRAMRWAPMRVEPRVLASRCS